MEAAEKMPDYGVTYAEIFERDGRWLMGPEMLGTIIAHARGKAPRMVSPREAPSDVIIYPPLPTVLDAISGEQRDIMLLVPDALLPIVHHRLALAVSMWLDEHTEARLNEFIGKPVTGQLLAAMDQVLLEVERYREAHGIGQLWACLSMAFGFGLTPPQGAQSS